MKYLKLILMFSFLMVFTSCEEEDDSLDFSTETPSSQNPGNNSGATSWAMEYWKRNDAGTYLDLTSSRPVFCANGEIVGGSYSEIDWQTSEIGYFTLSNAGDNVDFQIKKSGNGLILSPYDEVAQQTHSPAGYSLSSTFPCDGGGGNNGGGNGEGNGGNGNDDKVAIKFWMNYDYECGPISVSLNSVGSSQITGYFSGGPNCNSSEYGGYFSNLDPGTYSYSASCGNYTWSGSVTLDVSCTTFHLAI